MGKARSYRLLRPLSEPPVHCHRLDPGVEGRLSLCAGINRHVVGNARVLQERRKRIHLGPESYGRRREASAEA